MKVPRTLLLCTLFLGCAPVRNIAIPEAKVDTGDLEGAKPEDPEVTDDPTQDPPKETETPGQTPTEPEVISNPETPVTPAEPVKKDLPEFPGVHSAAATLQSFYMPATGLWPDGWWPSANSLTALIDYMELTGSRGLPVRYR